MKGLFGFLLLMLVSIWSAGVSAQAEAPAAESSSQVQHFPVRTIQIQGNTLLPEDELALLVAHLVGNERTLGDLMQGAAAVQRAYRKAGYGGVAAFVPEQDLSAGDVVIRVIEGKLAKLEITENQRYDEANIAGSLPHLRQGETPLIKGLDRDIQLANENPAKELRVTLMPGEKPGDIHAKVKVVEERPIRFLLGFDSSGTNGTPRFRGNIGIQHANLWNRDHIGTFQFQTAPADPSEVHVYSAGYRVPFYGRSAALDVFFAHSNINSVSTTTPAGPLGFTGNGDVGGFRLNRYLSRMGDYDHRITFGWDGRHYNNNCSVGVFGSAGCGTAGADVTILPISLGYAGQSQGPRHAWGFNTTISGNLGEAAARSSARRVLTRKNITRFGVLQGLQMLGYLPVLVWRHAWPRNTAPMRWFRANSWASVAPGVRWVASSACAAIVKERWWATTVRSSTSKVSALMSAGLSTCGASVFGR